MANSKHYSDLLFASTTQLYTGSVEASIYGVISPTASIPKVPVQDATHKAFIAVSVMGGSMNTSSMDKNIGPFIMPLDGDIDQKLSFICEDGEDTMTFLNGRKNTPTLWLLRATAPDNTQLDYAFFGTLTEIIKETPQDEHAKFRISCQIRLISEIPRVSAVGA